MNKKELEDNRMRIEEKEKGHRATIDRLKKEIENIQTTESKASNIRSVTNSRLNGRVAKQSMAAKLKNGFLGFTKKGQETRQKRLNNATKEYTGNLQANISRLDKQIKVEEESIKRLNEALESCNKYSLTLLSEKDNKLSDFLEKVQKLTPYSELGYRIYDEPTVTYFTRDARGNEVTRFSAMKDYASLGVGNKTFLIDGYDSLINKLNPEYITNIELATKIIDLLLYHGYKHTAFKKGDSGGGQFDHWSEPDTQASWSYYTGSAYVTQKEKPEGPGWIHKTREEEIQQTPSFTGSIMPQMYQQGGKSISYWERNIPPAIGGKYKYIMSKMLGITPGDKVPYTIDELTNLIAALEEAKTQYPPNIVGGKRKKRYSLRKRRQSIRSKK